MEPVKIPWPLSSAPGARPQESAGRLINCYAEPLQQESGPALVTYRRTPGLSRFATTIQTGFRGGHLVGTALVYAAFSGKLVTIDNAGVVSVVGNLAGTLPCTFANNNLNPTPQIGVVTENGAFVITAGSITAWPDADLPQPNSIAFQDGYFFFTIGDRRVFATDINAITVNSQTFTTIQSRSQGNLLRGIPYNGLMYFFCTLHCEVYQNAGSAIASPAFPYARFSVIDRGLLAANAIAGWEEGFGVPMWVADDFGVYRFQGGVTPEKVSPPDLDRLIEAVPDRTTLKASCHVHAGHKIWTISCPTWSWEFNLSTEKWEERWSTHSGLISTLWRGVGSVPAFNKWLMGSGVSGDMLYVNDMVYNEEGDPILWRMESGPVNKFPNSMRVGRADFDFVTGVGNQSGTANQQAPQVAISWSDDGGVSYGTPILRSLGAAQRSRTRVSILNPGRTQAQGRRWRIDVMDDVYVGFLGATMSVNARGP